MKIIPFFDAKVLEEKSRLSFKVIEDLSDCKCAIRTEEDVG